jgi:hypothetical protein
MDTTGNNSESIESSLTENSNLTESPHQTMATTAENQIVTPKKLLFASPSLFGSVKGPNVFESPIEFEFGKKRIFGELQNIPLDKSKPQTPKQVVEDKIQVPKTELVKASTPRFTKPVLDSESPFSSPQKSSPPRKKRRHDSNTQTQALPPRRESFWAQPHMPTLISGYVQVFFNLSILALILHLLLIFVQTVHRDVAMKSMEYSSGIEQEIFACGRLWKENRCERDQRVPAMEKICGEWEVCMNKDPRDVGKLKIGAETVAEVLNNLIEPLSTKTMVCLP